MSLRTCPQCQFLIDPAVTACPFCGADLAAPPPAAPPSPPPPPWGASGAPSPYPLPVAPKRRSGSRAGVIAAVVIIVGAAIGLKLAIGDTGNDHPKDWDPRVAKLVSFVEAKRGLAFEHPVPVDFVSANEYTERSRTQEGTLTEEQKASFKDQESFFRALGLIHGHVDLFSEENTLQDNGTLAFYDPATKRVTVRGTTLTPDLRVTLAHELTHALQDQHFDLLKIERDAATSGADFAARALAEGDALRIEHQYVDQLSDADKQAYDDAQPDSLDEAGLGEVPESLVALFGAPYQLGEPFVYALEAEGGDSAIDAAFRKPPTSEEQLLDPWLYVDGKAPKPLADLKAPAGAKVLDRGDFGALGLYMLLAERIDPSEALAAVDGWNGDAYVTYRKDDKVCVDAQFAGATANDRVELRQALSAWAEAMPAGVAKVAAKGSRAEVTTCDPGTAKSAAVTGAGAKALVLPEIRSYVFGNGLSSGLDHSQAQCASEHVIAAFSADQLNEGSIFEDQTFEQVEQTAATACTR
jgi:hypothetical protein